MQRKYYFGGATPETSEPMVGQPKKFTEAEELAHNSSLAECPDGTHGSSLLSYEEGSSMLEGDDSSESLKMPAVQVNACINNQKPLDAIVELNYEASSDEEEPLDGTLV